MRCTCSPDMPARVFSACRKTPGRRTCCPALPPPLPACSRRKAVRRRDAGGPRKPSPPGPPPATSRPSETWHCPAPSPQSPAARRWPPESPAQAALPRKYRGRATRRSAEDSGRPPEQSKFEQGIQSQRAPARSARFPNTALPIPSPPMNTANTADDAAVEAPNSSRNSRNQDT